MPFLPGVRKIRISTLILPGDFSRRIPTDNTARLVESIEKVGLINLPIIDEKRRLIAGHDRVFALKERGDEWVHVRVFQGSSQDQSIVQWAENHHRRTHNPDDKVWRQIVGAIEAVLPPEEPPPDPITTPPPAKRGRPITPRGKARREIAATAGVSLDVVERVERKARKAQAVEEPVPEPEPQLPPSVQTFGLTPEREVVADVLDAIAHYSAAKIARTKMEHEHRELAKMAKAPPPVFMDHDTLESLFPVQLCRWCEASPHRTTCDVCQGRGWLSAIDDLTPPPRRDDAGLPF